MKIKTIILMSLLLVVLAMGSVCAADTNSTDEIISHDITTDEILTEKDEGTFTALQNKINSAEASSTINLENDYTYDNGFSTDGIAINKSITINGNGHTLNGLSKSRIFTVEYNSDMVREYHAITLNNITFKNGYAEDGGVLYMKNKAISSSFSGPWYPKHCNVKINNCIFSDNHATKRGGAINSPSFMWSHGQENYLTVNNSVFTNNHAKYGGAIDFYDGSTTVINTQFISNAADEGGALLAWGGTTTHTVNNCIFTKNKANYGGAVYSWSDVSDCYITLRIYNSKFIENQPSGKNGVIYASESDVKSTIKGCSFIDSTKTVLSTSKVVATYGVSKKLVVALNDGVGNALKSKKVTLKVGSISKTLTTNANGQVSLDISSLLPKSYTAAVSFAGDEDYSKSSGKVSVTVKKATPKLTAKAKAFKKSVKTKKYSVTLKTNQNKVMKNIKLTLKVNKKTYAAKTNKKGVATFKITKLTKKGKYTAVVKFAGNKYYNTKTVKPKITIK